MERDQRTAVFLVLVASQALSLLGSRMSALAVALWLFATGGLVTPLALTALAAVLPRLLLAGPAGLLADRADRRRILLAAESAQAFASLLLLADLLAGSFATWHLYLIATLQAAGGAVQEPALQASFTGLLPPEERTRANALQQLAGPLAGVLAPACAGVALATFGVAGAVALDLLTFLVAAAALAVIRLPPLAGPATERRSALAGARAGLRYLGGRRDLLALLGLLGLANAVFLGAYLLYPPYLLLRTGSQALAGALLALIPLGALVGGALVGLAGRRVGSRAILPALGLGGGALVAVGVSRAPLPLGAALLALAISPAFVHAPLATLIQSTVPERLQGRVFAAQGALAQSLTPLVYLGVGPLVDRWLPGWAALAPRFGDRPGDGIGLVFAVGGALVAGLSLGAMARRGRTGGVPPPPRHRSGAASAGVLR
jgi:DHA3 family macrolide efflux protein-like MFS transporter